MGVVVVRPEDVRAFGANAALLLAQIEYWLKRPHAHCVREDSDGRKWCGQARAEWQLQLGLSAQQLRTALELLRRERVLVSERHLHRNRVTAFLRIDVVARTAAVRRKTLNVRGGSTQIGMGETNQIDLGESTRTYTDKTDVEIEERIGVAAPTHFSEGEKEVSRRPKSVIGVSVSDLKKGATGRKQATAPVDLVGDASRPGQLSMVFKHAWSDTYEDFLPSFSARELGQLKQLVGKCPGGVVGKVVDWAVRNWPVFVSAAVQREGAFGAPQLPTVGFLLRFAQTAVNSWQEHERGGGGYAGAPAKHPSQPASPKFVPPQPQKVDMTPEERPATLEEIAELLGKKLS